MSRAKSQAQLQREYRERLKHKDPELLRARDHEKYLRRCLRRKNIGTVQNVGQRSNHKNLYVEGIKHDDRVNSPYVEAPYHGGGNSVSVETKQRKIHARYDNARNTDNNSARKLYLIDENAYRNSARHEALAATIEKRPVAECGLPSPLENTALEHKIKSVLFKLLNSGATTMNTDSSHATNDYQHITTSPRYTSVKVITSAKPTEKPLCKKIVEKKNTRNTERMHVPKARKRTVSVVWDPIVF